MQKKPQPRKTTSAGSLSLRQKKIDQRQNVISELVKTEIEYIRDLKVTCEIYSLHSADRLKSAGINVAVLFGNIVDIIHVAEELLNAILPAMKGKEEKLQTITRAFLIMRNKLKSTYGEYCTNYEEALNLLKKYTEDKKIMAIVEAGIELLRHYRIVSLDLSSILIKPVQRIMKYPLILERLWKFTEDDHSDKQSIEQVWKMMTLVVSSINEYKRRQEIVIKYLATEDTLTARMTRLSVQSMPRNNIARQVEAMEYNYKKETNEELLMNKYPKSDLFFVKEKVVTTSPLYLEATRGTLVAVIKRHDPAADTTRWFVDSGSDKGFIQSNLLAPIPREEILERKYPKSNWFVVKEEVVSNSVLNLEAIKGTVVAVIKRRDPAGDVTRWFVDNGSVKGFIQSSSLEPIPNAEILMDKYPRSCLFVVKEKVVSTCSVYLGATRGTVVAVIKRQDPLGDDSMWLVDNGSAKGLIPRSILEPIIQSSKCANNKIGDSENILEDSSASGHISDEESEREFHQLELPLYENSERRNSYRM